MAANVFLARMWQNVAIMLFIATAMTAAANSSRITLFSILPPAVGTTDYVVSAGTTVTFRCRLEYNVSLRAPTIRLQKSYWNSSWVMADNDVFNSPPFTTDDRFSSAPLDNAPNGIDVYDWTITNVGIGDSGNYTCSIPRVSNSSATVTLNVAGTAEPTQLSLFLNDELQKQSTPFLINQKLLKIGQSYNLKCVVSGGNPLPNITLTSGSTVLTPSKISNSTTRPDTPLGILNRTIVAEFMFVMNTTYLGKALTCASGYKNSSTLSNSVIALVDNVLPHFDCPDQFYFDQTANSLALTCKIYSQNLTTYYVSWRNKTANLTCRGQKGVSVNLPEDIRYSLLVTAPQGNDIWWMMTLNVNNAASITDLSNITYNFVASSNVGQAVHPVTIVTKGTSDPTSGSLMTSAISYLTLLLGVVAAEMFNRL